MHPYMVICIHTIAHAPSLAQSPCHIHTWSFATNRHTNIESVHGIILSAAALKMGSATRKRRGKKRKGKKKERKWVRKGEKENDSAWGNKHHLLSGSLTARSRQVEKGGGQSSVCVSLCVCFCMCAEVWHRSSREKGICPSPLDSDYSVRQLSVSVWVPCY